jgi:hypothetical protein
VWSCLSSGTRPRVKKAVPPVEKGAVRGRREEDEDERESSRKERERERREEERKASRLSGSRKSGI